MNSELTPKQIVEELNRYIIGQNAAKRAVAIALRNRYRRSRLPEELRAEITPKNIIMKGPTGVGKTEIARRLAKIVRAPFIKVEATKYTEVGYVGRDVESMVRDLTETAVRMVKDEQLASVADKAQAFAEKRVVELLLKERKKKANDKAEAVTVAEIKNELNQGKLDEVVLNIEVTDAPKSLDLSQQGMEINIQDIMSNIMMGGKKRRKVTVKEAMEIFKQEEGERLLDIDAVKSEGVRRAEEDGIIFIDEIDKIASSGRGSGPDVSREGVQRDILPIVEGCTVMTKYGAVKTDYILFIASGAFQIASVNDLIPELQGRFPIQVELNSLTYNDFVEILTKPENSLTRQYAALLATDKVKLEFTEEAAKAMSSVAVLENETGEDIGARRLHTVMEQLLEDISFNAGGDYDEVTIVIDRPYVEAHLGNEIKAHDLKRYIL